MSPGETKSATAHVVVARCDLATFAAEADRVAEAVPGER